MLRRNLCRYHERRDVHTMRFSRGWLAAVLVAAGILAFAATSSGSTGRADAHGKASAAKASVIKIGLITDETGALAPDFGDVPQDFMARIAYQNSLGA